MQNIESYLARYRQNEKLAIRLVAPNFGQLPQEVIDHLGLTHRRTHYFFIFMIEGKAVHHIDLRTFNLDNFELLFILPNQIHQLPAGGHGNNFYKLAFDENTLSLLPRQYSFLVDPLQHQKIPVGPISAGRVKTIFELLHGLLRFADTDGELILAQLNSLLTEINSAYFDVEKGKTNGHLTKYTQFKQLIENHLFEQWPLTAIAEELALNSNGLYQIVKYYSGLSPRKFINNRLILEAKRKIYYSESTSVKELGFSLGFNDPEYFSRLFKKATGKTIKEFSRNLLTADYL